MAREPSWQTVAAVLADRLQHVAHCENHREDAADADCAPCRDRSAYRMWQCKAGIDPRRTEVDDGEVIDVFAHARGDVQYRAFGVTGSSASGDTAPYPTEEADRGDAQYRAFGDSDRAHVDLCGRGPADPCFEDDFTEECSCWCHRRNQAALVTGSSASGDTAPYPLEVRP